MTFLIDNDIIEKLCKFDLAADAVAHVFGGPDNCLILPTARYKFYLNAPQKGQRKYGDAFERIKNFVESVKSFADVVNECVLTFEDELEIDAGDAVLVSFAVQSDERLIVTGDKRFVASLAKSSHFATYRVAMQGRFLCLEQIIFQLLETLDFTDILNRIVPARSCDTAIRAAFGSGMMAERADVQAALEAYIDDLHKKAGGLLRK